jgi:hypothetical protein
MRILAASALFVLTFSVDAQILTPDLNRQHDERDPAYRNDPYSRNDPYYENDRSTRRQRRQERRRNDDYGYGRSGSGYGLDPLSLLGRVRSDVRSVAANNYGVEKKDRKHFDEVEEELGKFERKYRDGKYDRNNLKDAAESLRHLASSSGIRSSRDRRLLQDALSAVEELRSGNYETNSRSRVNDRGSIWDLGR